VIGVAWWITGRDIVSKVHQRQSYWQRWGWNRTLCGKEVGAVQNLNGVRATDAARIQGRCKVCERIRNGKAG
jgi:hypothetical protein